LLAKLPGPPDGDCQLSDTQGNNTGQSQLGPAAPNSDEQAAAAVAVLGQDAEQLLLAVSVYREPADRNAIVFQLGRHDWTAARAPDKSGPAPPYEPPSYLPALLTRCVVAELLSAVPAGPPGSATADCWLVDPWIASTLHARLAAAGRSAELAMAHRRAAEYWQWRSAAWPQDRRADLHDLLEARYHLFSAGDAEQASEITRVVCAQLHAWGDLGREADLIKSTLDSLPTMSASWPIWMHELGAIYQLRGEHHEAKRCFTESVELFTVLGDHRGIARGQHSLGVLAQAEGDYRRAERHYRRSGAAEKRAADSAATAAGAADGPAPAPGNGAGAGSAADRPAPAPGPTAAADPGPFGRRQPDRSHQADRLPAAMTLTGSTGSVPADLPLLPVLPPVHKPATPAMTGMPALTAAPDRPARGPAVQAGRRVTETGPTVHADDRMAETGLAVRVGHLSSTGPAARRPAAARQGLRRRPVTGLSAVALGIAALIIAGISAALARAGGPPESSPAPVPSLPQVRALAASWVAEQVSRSAVIGCDPAMCWLLRQRGIPAGELLTLGPGGAADPLASNVVIATAAVRNEFGARLTSIYAPIAVASFGTGTDAIQVRAIAPDGARAFMKALSADLESRRRFGADLLRNSHLLVSGQARAELAAGQVDARLLATLATMADIQPLRVISFGDAGPGAAAGVPLRSVDIAPHGPAGTGWLRAELGFLSAQQSPFLPSTARPVQLAGYGVILRFEYASPGPLGLLTASGTSPGAVPYPR
jgi:tetratricopeptide (TPR) repeat protein